MAAVVACRKSHTSEQYYGNRASLMRMTKDLIVKPGRTKNAVTFPQYYLANWDPIAPMWVYAHRRTLRLQVICKLLNIRIIKRCLQGCGSTQGCEALFRVLKLYEKQLFGQRIPVLQEMIPKIAQALSKRLLLRRLRTENKRVKYHSPDPTIDAALEEASWKLNPIGNKLFYESINLACKRQDSMKICEEGVIEVYEKYGEKFYVTDGVSCSCSCFKQLLYCRHIPFVRFKTQKKLFDDGCFHTSLTKCYEFDGNSYGEDVGTEVSDYEQPPSPGLELHSFFFIRK